MKADPRITTVRKKLEHRMAELEETMARGKGEWGKHNYIRDDTWSHWHGELMAYGIALDILDGKI